MRKMADDDYTDSFSDDSEDEGVEQSQGSVELFSGYYGQEGFRAEYIYDAIEAAGRSESSPKQRRLKINFGGWKLPKVRKKKKSYGDVLEKVLPENPVFGVHVDVAVQRSVLADDGVELPTVFRQCIDFLEERGLEQEGLYRLPGVKSLVQNLKDAYDRGERVDLSSSEIHTVASLLKLYLRELPEPIFTYQLGALFDDAVSQCEGEMQVRALQDVLSQLPLANRLLLGWLMVHIQHVTEKESKNLMSISNVIVVFQPTLQASHQVLYALMQYTSELFSDIQLTRYIPPELPQTSESAGPRPSLGHPDILELGSEEDIAAEITKLENEQQVVLSTLKEKFDAETDNMAWEIQRLITDFRRKLKMLRKKKGSELQGGDDKTESTREDAEENWEVLTVADAMQNEGQEQKRLPTPEDIKANMAAELQDILLKTEASLVKERNALLVLREALKDEIEKERSAVARLKEKLSLLQDGDDSSEESGDEAVLEAKFLTSLKEVRDLRSENEEIKEHIMSELESIALLRVEEGQNRQAN